MGSPRLEPSSGSKASSTQTPTAMQSESHHIEAAWKAPQPKEGDTAMALFHDSDELHEPIDPAEARRLLWKIDFMVLPYLAVCYAFFYIDKVCVLGLPMTVAP